jgi:hypothetical protein
VNPVTRNCFNLFLSAALLGACAGRGEPEGNLPILEQRLTDEEITRLLPKGTPAGAVRELLGTPARAYVSAERTETWEYRLTGFQHPRTLYVELGGGQQVKDVYVLERRGATTRPSAPHR